ncbi:insulinase family protein [Candidatus Falkowbacteria bacterium]|nr:insulinase family protein [Candidatus Falkowbacteria bacterium]
MYTKIILKNNVRLILAPLKESKAVTLLVLFKVGSRYEGAKNSGSSHFIEHMMFKGTKKRPNTLAISKELDGVGAEFNAFTGKDYTGYYIKADSRHLGLAVDVLSDMLLNSKFDRQEVEREKGVIIEEINMYEDNPLMYVDDLLEQLMFKNEPLGRSIAGTRETVRNLDNEKLITYRDKFYRGTNIVIGLVGNFKQNNVREIERSFKFKKSEGKNKFKPVALNQIKPQIKLKYKETEQTQIALGFFAYPYNDPRLYALQILSVILGGNMSSRLFLKIRERNGLAYFIRSGLSIYEDTGGLIIQSGLDKTRLDKALSLILAELKKIKNGVNLAELKRAQEYLAGKIILDLEDTSHLCQWYGQQELLTDKILTPEEKINKIMAVTGNEVEKAAQEVIDFKKANLAIIGPFKDEKRFAEILRKMA